MEETIKLLEDRVSRTVQRVRVLSAERQALEEELEGLRERLERVEGEAAASNGGAEWPVARDRAVELIRKTLNDIREP